MTIAETLFIEIPEIEEAFSGQADEYRMQKLCEGLLGFIWSVAGKHCKTVAEEDLLLMMLAQKLFGHFNARAVAEVLKERLLRPRA